MSVTAATGFRAAGVAAGLKSSGAPDVAVVVNDGPDSVAAGVFTTNTVAAAPVLWSRQVLTTGHLRAVVLNSGGANACTGPDGFADTHRTAEHAAQVLELAPIDVAVCSTGLIGVRLDLPALLQGVDSCAANLSDDGGDAAAHAILTTDTVAKQAVTTLSVRGAERGDESAGASMGDAVATIGGMAKGAGMLAPGMATMLAVLTTDARVTPDLAQEALSAAVELTFNRIDSDGCMSTNDTVLLLANGASGVEPQPDLFVQALTEVCGSLARAMVADAEGATKEILVQVTGAASEADALAAARGIAGSNLFKTAMFGEDPNWGRIVAAAGASTARFEPDRISVSINGVEVCRQGAAFGDPTTVDLSSREVLVRVDLGAGAATADIWTNDLSHAYVHENSAYSS